MHRVKKIRSSSLLLLFCAWALGPFLLAPATAWSYDDQVIHIDQGWSQADRDTFYWISQGTTILPYDIFLNLEVADGQELFRSDANSDTLWPDSRPRQTRRLIRMACRLD